MDTAGLQLPKAFIERMRLLLADESDAFFTSLEQERYYGLRRNPLKASEDAFLEKMPFDLQRVGWAKEGYYYRPEEQPGRHLLHEAGAYYIQEPSAMAVAEILEPKPGELILDLCAAPGGKSTQIAGKMDGKGLLVSNEIIQGRAKVLSQNIERMGIRNCVVCNEAPGRLADFFPHFFDRILVDAPCSGEGMFRKDKTAIEEWSAEHVAMCADRQLDILRSAAQMLREGGILVYSTCTFAPEEDEEVVSRFLSENDGFVIERIERNPSFSHGRAEWVKYPADGIEGTVRIMPHKAKGEGHFIARLRKRGNNEGGGERHGGHKKAANRQCRSSEPELEKRVRAFLTDELGLGETWLQNQGGTLQTFGEQIYLVPQGMIGLAGLKVVRPGLHLGTDKRNRIEPSHALALSVMPEETAKRIDVTKQEAERYIRGEGLVCGDSCADRKGWLLLVYEGYPIGFGKNAGGQIKNHYPKGLRKYENSKAME